MIPLPSMLLLLFSSVILDTSANDPPRPVWPWAFNWSSVQPFNYGNNSSGFDNNRELERKKRYKILFTDNDIDGGYNKTWRWNEESRMSEQVRQYFVAAPSVPAFIYRSVKVCYKLTLNFLLKAP